MDSQKVPEGLAEQLVKALEGVLDGVEGYESEGFDLRRFWNPVSIAYAKTILAKAWRHNITPP